MNRFLSVALLFLLSLAAFAQERYVTHFLGIPVDGSKTEMLRKLREKGFRTSKIGDLEGEFNGRAVRLFVATNRDRVCRIALEDAAPSSKTGIKIRFNELCRQFKNNPKYMSFGAITGDPSIPDDEDVSYEITVNDKRYEAGFYQKDPAMLPDTASLSDKLAVLEAAVNRTVWFMIDKDKYSTSDFRILMFYDNKYNRGDDGSDL